MRVLVIGGSGFIGGAVALRLRDMGHDVVIGSRRPPLPSTALATFDFIAGDYAAGDFNRSTFQQFNAVIHAAGNDARQRNEGETESDHLDRTNARGIPDMFEVARQAGVSSAVYVGSFYPQVLPQRISTSTYVHSRYLADERCRALANANFRICSVNPPYVIGWIAGLDTSWLGAHARYVLQDREQAGALQLFAPPGAVNFMSLAALTDAVVGALFRGRPGHAYLVGDENLTFKAYFEHYLRAAGRSDEIPIWDQEHPLMPDWSLYGGRGENVCFTPNPAEQMELGYRSGDLVEAFQDVVQGAVCSLVPLE